MSDEPLIYREEKRARIEAAMADAYHDSEPGRWPEWASPARMSRDRERDWEEERDRDV